MGKRGIQEEGKSPPAGACVEGVSYRSRHPSPSTGTSGANDLSACFPSPSVHLLSQPGVHVAVKAGQREGVQVDGKGISGEDKGMGQRSSRFYALS